MLKLLGLRSVRRLVRSPTMKVLIVDDNPDAAMSLSMLINVLGYDNRVAHDGLEALDVADRFEPDVVLLDLGMPVMDGFEACRRIRQRVWGRRAAVVAVTGYGDAEDRAKSAAAGFDLHLLKPVSPIVMARTLTEVADRLLRADA